MRIDCAAVINDTRCLFLHPRSATICTYGKAKLGVGCIVVFSILYNIPRFFEVSWEPVKAALGEGADAAAANISANATGQHQDEDEEENGSQVELQMTSLRQNPDYISIYITWMYLVFMYVLPFGGLSVLNMLMFLDVR
jgi:hypothetical protein